MSIPLDDLVESVLCSVLPGDNQRAFGVQDLALATSGLGALPWAALRYRYLGDRSAATVLWPALAGTAAASPHASVRKRSGLLASLVLAEEASPVYVAGLSVEVVAEALLLASRSLYYRRLREPHLALRAKCDTWAREGLGRIAARLRG